VAIESVRVLVILYWLTSDYNECSLYAASVMVSLSECLQGVLAMSNVIWSWVCQMRRTLDFKLSPCFECRMFSSGLFPGVCSLNANVSEQSVCSIFIDGRYESGTEFIPKRWPINFRRRRLTQKKAYNIQNTAEVWNQESRKMLHCSVFLKILQVCTEET
jgi:hypothetical protein